MSSKWRKEKSYSIHGMQSILSAFINRHQFAIKPYDSYVTNRASNGCLFRYLEQFGYVKKNTQWKIRRYKSTSLFQITVGYNQWCHRLHQKHTVQAIPSTHTVQAIPSKRKEGKRRGWKRKWFISKKKKKEKRGGRETKEKDIMKRRQEGGEEEKDGDRGETKKKRKEKKRGIGEGEEDGRKARSAAQSMHPPKERPRKADPKASEEPHRRQLNIEHPSSASFIYILWEAESSKT